MAEKWPATLHDAPRRLTPLSRLPTASPFPPPTHPPLPTRLLPPPPTPPFQNDDNKLTIELLIQFQLNSLPLPFRRIPFQNLFRGGVHPISWHVAIRLADYGRHRLIETRYANETRMQMSRVKASRQVVTHQNQDEIKERGQIDVADQRISHFIFHISSCDFPARDWL